jgi:glutamyl-Q tRNA(Asp) synthetase
LHLGSLLAAVGSFLDARARGGRWLVRIEDLDPGRVVPGCGDAMLRTLEAFGLTWDGTVEHQSRRTELYARGLEELRARGLTFECSCTRSEPRPGRAYPGTCRSGPRRPGPTATRFRVPEKSVCFDDRVQGPCRFELPSLGDVIIRRRDGAFAYQLAVVVDDALQGVTDVVRGADLLDNTPWQIALQEALGLPVPRYTHLPVVLEPCRGKLAKSRGAIALDPGSAGRQLHQVLTLLRQGPPATLKSEPVATLLDWARRHWDLDRFQRLQEVTVTA